MSSSGVSSDISTEIPGVGTIDMKLEVVTLPVADVDRAKRFYESLGWRLDADFASGDEWRVGQLTPPRSPCSGRLGQGYTTAPPGPAPGTVPVVDDNQAARRRPPPPRVGKSG